MPLKLLKGAKINESINIFVPNYSSCRCRCSLALEIPLALFSLYVFNGKLGLKSAVSSPSLRLGKGLPQGHAQEEDLVFLG